MRARALLATLLSANAAMSIRLVLVRHGAVARSRAAIRDDAFYGGNVDVPLSEVGEAEADAAAAYIAAEHASGVAAVWSSPMCRAMYGARAISAAVAAATGSPPLPVQTYESFREIDRGEWTNMTKAEIEERHGEGAIARAAQDPEYARINGGEGMGDVWRRVHRQRDELMSTLGAGDTAVIVSHLWVTRAMLCDALGIDDPLAVDVPTASVSVVDYPPEGPPVVVLKGHKPPLAPK